MITNERQYAISKAELRRFEEATEAQREEAPIEGVDPRIQEAMGAALESEIEELRGQVRRYEELRAGHIDQREFASLRDISTALIEARIAAGLTQRELGARLGRKEQQIQRWEANLYSGVGVERLQEVADAVGMEIKETVSYSVSAVSA